MITLAPFTMYAVHVMTVILVYLDVYKQKKFIYIGQEDHLLWEEYGIKLHFSSHTSESDVHIQGTVSVLSRNDNDYKFPEGCKLVSAVYDISANKPFPNPVTVELHHGISLQTINEASRLGMTFMVADAEEGPPYEFKELNGGEFECGSPYGRIQCTHFTLL